MKEAQTVFEKINIAEGLNLYLFPAERFKTVYVHLVIHRPLDEKVTANALLGRVLLRGCRKYPNMRRITQFLESLYGASFGGDVDKIGERHILELRFAGVAERFLPKRLHTLGEGLEFIYRIINEPLIERGGLQRNYLSQEKTNLKHLIETLIDNKMAYAQQRCLEEMCRDEPFRVYEYGRVEDIPGITAEGLLSHLRTIIQESPIDIFIVGRIKRQAVEKLVRRIFRPERLHRRAERIISLGPTIVNKSVSAERLVRESLPAEQSKLVMGFRTYTTWRDKEVTALMVFNGILGAYPHSKLFQNVREKAGLAYYAFSSLEKTKGLLIVQAGIDSSKFDQSTTIIKQQLDEIRQGDISDEEFSNTKKSLEDQLKSIPDTPPALISYTLEQLINEQTISLEALREAINTVSREEITRLARKIKLDTIYFLSNQ